MLKSEIIFKDIAANFEYNISIALTNKDLYYIWGKCGEEELFVPERTPFKYIETPFPCRI